MKQFLFSLCLAILCLGVISPDVQAKRLGGGSSSGMKRQAPAQQPAQTPPASPAATPGQSAAGAAATPPKRSWMGPLAGLAAGLGIAALLSHFGLAGAAAEMIGVALLVMLAVGLLIFLFRRFGPNSRQTAASPQGMTFAGAGAPAAGAGFGSGMASAQPAAAPTALAAPALPAGFDAAEFERVAKVIFIRMQAANDAANLDDLRQFATPEMFANFRLELQERKGAPQQTDVVQLDAKLVDFAQEGQQQIVSVRFHGLIREEVNGPANAFDEVWHLVKPLDGSREWAIAGIAQNAH